MTSKLDNFLKQLDKLIEKQGYTNVALDADDYARLIKEIIENLTIQKIKKTN